MKKITRFLALAAVAALPFAFTSCDDDDYWDGPRDDYYWWSNYDNGNYGWNNGYYNGNDEDRTDQMVIEAQMVAGREQMDCAKMMGITPAMLTLMGRLVFWPP